MSQDQRPSQLFKVLDFDRHNHINATICEWLTLGDFVLLCQTCKHLYERRAAILSDFIDINTRLQHYFDDPLAFRAQQGQWQVLLSGPFALQAMECFNGAAPVLDIFADGDEILSYLKKAENYEGGVEMLNVSASKSYNHFEQRKANARHRVGHK